MADEREEVRVGDYVELSAHRMGMVKYVGEIHGKKGIFYGVELWKGNGKHNGTYQGIEYFDCINDGMGVFVIPKAILYILDVPNNYDPFKQLKAKKAAQEKKRQERAAKYNKIDNKIKKNKNKNKDKDKDKDKTKYISNNKQSQKPKQQKQQKQESTKSIYGPSSSSTLKNKNKNKDKSINTEQKTSGDITKLRDESESVMSVDEFKSISLKSCLGKGDNFDIAKRICKFYDNLFNDTDTVALVSNIDLKPSYSVTMEGNYKRIETYKRDGKYIIVYRAKPHKNPNVIVNKQCFKSVVKGLAIDNDNTYDILIQLNKLFGEGCHVVRSKKISFDIYSRFSDGYECELRLPNGGDYILAWRR